jgi:hypothetical protein
MTQASLGDAKIRRTKVLGGGGGSTERLWKPVTGKRIIKFFAKGV